MTWTDHRGHHTLRRVIGGWERRESGRLVGFLPSPATEREARTWAGMRTGNVMAWRVRTALGWSIADLAAALDCSIERAESLDAGWGKPNPGQGRVLRLLEAE